MLKSPFAAEGDDLARTVERPDAVGLAKRGADGAIVERADDPLLAALADPVARPERVESGVENEHGVSRGEVAPRCARQPADEWRTASASGFIESPIRPNICLTPISSSTSTNVPATVCDICASCSQAASTGMEAGSNQSATV
jgi:hypothetical protein